VVSWTEGDVQLDGGWVHYHRTGDGRRPPVVLLHGFSDDGLCWRRVAEVLQDTFDVVMIDARNHGDSSTATVDVPDMAADVAAVISTLELDRPAVVGHSIGAAIAAELAGRRPELVSRLVLEDPPWRDAADDSGVTAQQRREGARTYLASLTTMTEQAIRELGHRQHPDWGAVDIADWVVSKQRVRVEAAESLGGPMQPDAIDTLRCPTLLIHGEPARGGLLTADLAERLAAAHDGLTTCSIDGAGHNIRRENFERYVDVLGAYLAPE
jgi:pimeloyl-ACP methyl ester carboxylesterase